MAVKATAEITLRDQTDAEAIILWHYVSTSATKPNKPNTTSASATPSGWSKSEPSVSSDSDLSKYDYTSLQTVWGDGTCDWGDVNLSASYEASKRAWNKAGSVENQLNNLEIGGRNLLPISIWKWKESGTITNAGITITEESDGWFRVSGTRTGTSGGNIGLWDDNDFSTPATDGLDGLEGRTLTFSVEVEGTPFVSGSAYNTTTHVVFYGISSGKSWRLGGYRDLEQSFVASSDFSRISEIRYYIGANVPDGTTIDGRFRVKAEFGNKATDWTPAPEDVTNDINTVSTAMSEANEGLADSIAGVSKSLEEANTRITNLTKAVEDADADRAKWVHVDSENGLTIGATGSSYNLVLDNNSVNFMVGDQLAATASVDAFIPTALRLGDYVFSGSGGFLYIDYQPLQTQ